MKSLFLIIVLVLTIAIPQSKAQGVFSKEQIEKAQKDATQKAESFRKRPQGKVSPIMIQYRVDTMMVSAVQSNLIDINYTTAGMLSAADIASNEYDALISKYDTLLCGIFEGEDLHTYQASQTQWRKFIEAEAKTLYLPRNYMELGGGTIQSVVSRGRYIDMLKSRLNQLFEYYHDIKIK